MLYTVFRLSASLSVELSVHEPLPLEAPLADDVPAKVTRFDGCCATGAALMFTPCLAVLSVSCCLYCMDADG